MPEAEHGKNVSMRRTFITDGCTDINAVVD
jgi:hypothetical protein